MTTCFLRMGNDYLEDAQKWNSINAAKMEFLFTARDLARYDQTITASIHIAPTLDEVVEYPDYVLSLGPKGGLNCERA